jgi:hypothetical protein
MSTLPCVHTCLLHGLRAYIINVYYPGRLLGLGLYSVLSPRLYRGKAKMFNDWSNLPEKGQTAVME